MLPDCPGRATIGRQSRRMFLAGTVFQHQRLATVPTMTTAKIDPQLQQALQAEYSSDFLLLVRVDQIDDGRERVLRTRGVAIRRRLTMLPTYAVTCSGAIGLELLDLPWVQHIEEDRPVYAL